MNESTTGKRSPIRRRSAAGRRPQRKTPPAPKLRKPAVSLPTTDASATPWRWAGFAAWAAATIFVSAFLLFQVQPIISKMILPWFGGTPMVWTTCLLFFQTLLLFGYTYAHVLIRQRPPVQVALHLALLIVAVLLLPITPDAAWKPAGSSQPTLQILLLLLAHVGLPYFLLSSTSPLVQAWFSRVYAGRSPYRLYALSNVSSMLALLSYPFVFEPAFDSPSQGRFWSLAFGLFVFLCGYLCVQMWRSRPRADEGPARSEPLAPLDASAVDPPTWGRKLLWLILPAWASMMLLAVTNHLCQDVAAIPFLWIVPLCLYLLSFILCFDSPRWYRRGVFGWMGILAILTLSVFMLGEVPLRIQLGVDVKLRELPWNFPLEGGLYLAVLFLVCMLCHGELVRRKPEPRHLTLFYLMVSAGGALGGIFVALVCPVIFSTYLEMNLGLAGGYLLAMVVVIHLLRGGLRSKRWWLYAPVLLLIVVGFIVVEIGQIESIEPGTLATTRSFYGVLSVNELDKHIPQRHRRALYHGRVLHGSQLVSPGQELTLTEYYTWRSGIGVAMQHYPREGPRRVGVLGLGTGTMAAFGRPGDTYRFYEINPQVVELSRRYFTYLDKTPATVELALGDARLSMEREAAQQFDMIVMDAFGGDAIPVHLLTREAFAVYRKHLREGGILAVHISNRHLDLGPVVAGLAEHYGMETVEISAHRTGRVPDASSTWMLVTENEAFLRNEAVQEAAEDGRTTFKPIRMWTDQYSNLFQIIDF